MSGPDEPGQAQEAGRSELLAVAEELYGLPLGDFTPARDARVKQLKGSPLAAAVKAMRKPATAAWVVDLLVRRETEQVEQVIAVGAALREAQAGMDAAQLRELTKQRRQLTAAVTTRARSLARGHGLKVTEAVAAQVEATLTAAMVDPEAARAVRSGLLVAPLTATGVDAVDAAAAVALPDALGFEASPVEEAPVQLHVVPDPEPFEGPDEEALEEARTALADAEEQLVEARREQEAAAAEVERLRARELQVGSEIEELRRRLAELEDTAAEVEDDLADAEDARDDAAAVAEEAERTRAEAEAALRRLEG